jgi:hypothetical protein
MILAISLFFVIVLVICAVFYYVRKYNSNTANNYSTASTAIYNVVAAISIMAAGIWAISTFDLLNQRDIAQAQLKELKDKLKNIESSKIELITEVVDYAGADTKTKSKGLIVKIKLTNVGNTPIEFDLSNYPVKIYEVAAKGVDMGYMKMYEPTLFSKLAPINGNDENTPLTSFVSLMSSERSLSYFAVLPSKKMYYVVFSTQANFFDEDEDEDEFKACDKEAGCKWFVSKYLYLN